MVVEDKTAPPSAVDSLDKPSPLHNQRFEANHVHRESSYNVVISSLVKGQYFGAEYLFNKETKYK